MGKCMTEGQKVTHRRLNKEYGVRKQTYHDGICEKTCINCKKEYQTVIQQKKFCSKKCGEIYRRDKKEIILKKCKYCNNSFYTNKKNKKYCSEECYKKEANNKIKKNFKLKNPPVTIVKKCLYCNENFIWSSSISNKKFCSKKCGGVYQKNRLQDIQNGKIEDVSGAYLYYKLRFEVFKRDNFTCKYCGRNVIENKIKLCADHIHPRAKGGKYIMLNLITSCEECNLGKRDALLEARHIEKIKKVVFSEQILKEKVKNE